MWRRSFIRSVLGGAGLAGLPGAAATDSAMAADGAAWLPAYTRAQTYRSRKQSSHDVTGGNADAWPIKAGAERTVFEAKGAGAISHIWFTIAARSAFHLKELVLRAYWDGNAKPSVETPVGDLFGLNLGDYVIYQNAFLACSPGQSLNCYFSMPYRTGARLTVTNEGSTDVGAFYSNIDYLEMDELPADALYFHAQYRQAVPNVAQQLPGGKNPTGATNYVFAETRGRGHLMGVTLGVIQNAEWWMGEGDDMIFIDDPTTPAIIGTGTEDYFLGSWDFGGRMHAQPFAHLEYGAPLIQSPERIGGRYDLYRFHGDNPVTFTRYLRHTIEHGHANNRADNYYSCCYWYQEKPFTDFPPLPPVEKRIPTVIPG
ncbi:MAG TPA: glycoside hydrolase family 172 protein [Gemmatimonadales bacterium]|nr:glycoside hydrolase family 172 protein [Gemmatimonadales bacterium]